MIKFFFKYFTARWLAAIVILPIVTGLVGGAITLVEHAQEIALHEARKAAEDQVVQQVQAAQAKAALELAQKQAELHKALEAGSQLDTSKWNDVEKMVPKLVQTVPVAPIVDAKKPVKKGKSHVKVRKSGLVGTRSFARDLNRAHGAASRLLADDTAISGPAS